MPDLLQNHDVADTPAGAVPFAAPLWKQKTSLKVGADGVEQAIGRFTQAAEHIALRFPSGIVPGTPRSKVYDLVEGTPFQGAVTAVIVLNAIYIGIETDRNFSFTGSVGSGAAQVYQAFNLLFTGIFLVELCLRLFALRAQFFRDSWNLFDFVLVAISVADTIVAFGQTGEESSSFLSVLRLLKGFRVARVLRLLRLFKELWLMVRGLIGSLRVLFWTWVLLAVIIYMFAIVLVQVVGQPQSEHVLDVGDMSLTVAQLCGNVPRAMFTLFQLMTTEGWADISRGMENLSPGVSFMFVFFISLTTFAVMNVVVAAIVDGVVGEAFAVDHDCIHQSNEKRKESTVTLYQIFRKADKDGNTVLSREEYTEILKDEEVMGILREFEISPHLAAELFNVLDYDDSGHLDPKEFVEGCLQAQGEARADTMIKMHCDVMRLSSDVASAVDSVEKYFAQRAANVALGIDIVTRAVAARGPMAKSF